MIQAVYLWRVLPDIVQKDVKRILGRSTGAS